MRDDPEWNTTLGRPFASKEQHERSWNYNGIGRSRTHWKARDPNLGGGPPNPAQRLFPFLPGKAGGAKGAKVAD